MRNIALFAEDAAHEVFLGTLLRRLAAEHGLQVDVHSVSVRGGHGKVLAELKQYLREVRAGRIVRRPIDLLVVGTDANCKGLVQRKREVDDTCGDYKAMVVCAIPDPHIERWMLLDPAAFRDVVGKGCPPPDLKCQRDRYKQLLRDAVRNAGIISLLGGVEYAEDIAKNLDVTAVGLADASFGRLRPGRTSSVQAMGPIEGFIARTSPVVPCTCRCLPIRPPAAPARRSVLRIRYSSARATRHP